ncbi:MAG: DNA adenine methylase [Candidatus Nanopelagicales bacterium]|nr:DNA adenine methylase [Candidatus Nanopelagicales bacterium]MDZ4249810.1 DNA adenine methylase [Candidatus Nanopelagicales bacterium]
MIKYLGSKRRLVPVLGAIATAVEAKSALDLFTGTTRVAQEFKRRGLRVTAVDTASYAKVLADTYIASDATEVDKDHLSDAIDELNRLPGQPGYFTETFCVRSRYFQPHNGARVDAIRDRIELDYAGTALYPILLTALMLAADRADSTTGLQMAYLKSWAQRSYKDLHISCPELLSGPGAAVMGDALQVTPQLGRVDLAYLDPPYNQHRYFTNYHVWETLVRWDAPAHYGVACKRVDAREAETRSDFNSKRTMPGALRAAIGAAAAETLIVSYNNEAWVTADELLQWCGEGREAATLLRFDSKRYVGAQIGIHDPNGRKVGRVSHLRNVEYLVVAGSREKVAAAVDSSRT